MFKDAERPPVWDIHQMFPDQNDNEIAETVADFFNKISAEFRPIGPLDEQSRSEWVLELHEVADMLRSAKNQNHVWRAISFLI